MNALLICPADRPAVVDLAQRGPLVIAPLLGRSVLEYWIEALAARGAQRITVLAADRPNRVRDHVGDGRRWGVQLEIMPMAHEPTVEEASARFTRAAVTAADVILVDHLPGRPDLPLFESYAGWFAAQRAWMPQAVTPGRIGVRERSPGVWVGLRAEIDPSAELTAPCWVGDYARIGAHVRLGPGAILGDRVVVEEGARILESVVGPDTLVGKYVSVQHSLADGALLTNWETRSTVQVPDPFLLADLGARHVATTPRTSLPGRLAAGLAMLITIPFAVGVVLLCLVRGEAPWQLRLALRAQRGTRRLATETFAYYELACARNWLRRWPQFWSVLRGDMTWVGNRPLRPTQALTLANDFERLWLAAPVGLISLADAYGCPEGVSDEAIAHASYYAVHGSRRLDAEIVVRALARSVLVWPIPHLRRRRREPTVPLLIPKQEL